jgi:hypothetical protein
MGCRWWVNCRFIKPKSKVKIPISHQWLESLIFHLLSHRKSNFTDSTDSCPR